MKKLGYFLLSFLPFLLALIAQFTAMFYMMGATAVFALIDPKGTRRGITGTLYPMLSDNEFNGCIMIVYCLIIIGSFGLWYYRNFGGEYLPDIRTTFHPLQFVGIVILVPGIQFLTSYLIAILSVIFPSWLEEYMELMETSGLGDTMAPMMLTYAIIVGPIAEELIFRGVTLRSFRRIFPFWLANLCQAVMFGVYHMNWLQGVYAGALGLILGFVCEKGGSIYLSMFLHILYNFWGTIVTPALTGLGISDLALGLLMLVTMVISLSIGGIIFPRGQQKKALTVKRLQTQES
jgi:membrane protease YdiL (CAAX protease family)